MSSMISHQHIFHQLFSVMRHPRSRRSLPRLQSDDEPSTLPELPPELWILILRYATSSYLALDDHTTTTSQTVSFLSLAHSHSHLQYRLATYRASMHRKILLSLVSKAWNTYTQPILLEFVWLSRASQAHTLATLLTTDPSHTKGTHIRRLHIETPTLERCSPADLRAILDHAPHLVIYSDYRSLRRSFYRDQACNPHASPDQLLAALAHPNNSLKRLSWTNYDDVSFHIHMSPMLESTAANLEFLELNFCSTHLHSMFPSFSSPSSSQSTTTQNPSITLTLPSLRSLKVTLDNATFAVLATWSMPQLTNLSVLSADFSYASSGFAHFFIVHGPKITQLELGHSSSSIEEHYLTAPPPPPSPSPWPAYPHLHLDPMTPIGSHLNTNTNLHPHHSHLNPNLHSNLHSHPHPRSPALAAWCPNLREFICSADAEWNWQSPDWIAPHVLLPSHPAVQLIGIRDVDKRLRDDLDLFLGAGGWGGAGAGYGAAGGVTGYGGYVGQGGGHGGSGGNGYNARDDAEADQPFFMLVEQIGSLVRKEAFPSLRYIRDMSWESDVMRRGGVGRGMGVGVGVDGMDVNVNVNADVDVDMDMDMDVGSTNTYAGNNTQGGDVPRKRGFTLQHTSPPQLQIQTQLDQPHSTTRRTRAQTQVQTPTQVHVQTRTQTCTYGTSSFPYSYPQLYTQSSSSSSSSARDKNKNKEKTKAQARPRPTKRATRETRATLRFWRGVLERCAAGGVWLEDFRGVNVTLRDLRRAACEAGVEGERWGW